MGSGKIASFLKRILGMILCVFIGIVFFVFTTLLLYRNNLAKRAVSYVPISESDSCYLKYPIDLRKSKDGMLLLYVETSPCARCSESVVLNVVNTIKEAGLTVEPIMLFHPVAINDSVQINDYFVKFNKHINLVVSCEDSIMIKNPWMQEGFGFYGIVTDSTDMVKFAGSFLDPGFLACCSREFGKTQGQTSR